MTTINVIWLDSNYDNEENSSYLKELDAYKELKNICFRGIDKAMNYIKHIKFEETNIITSGKLYTQFILKFHENINNIYIIPKIIIFTKNMDEFLKFNREYKNFIEDPFYNLGETKISFEDIKDFILKPLNKKIINRENEQNNNTKILKHLNILNKNDNLNLTFEYIDCKEKLYYPLLFKSLIEITKIDKTDLFTESLYNKYAKNNEKVKYLLNIIKDIINIPIELLSKYYARLYTLDSTFYSDINKNLRENKKRYYLTYIKVLYEGLKLKSLPLATDNVLFRGCNLLKNEIDIIQKYLNDKKERLPGAIVFSKTFLSFSKDEGVAKEFLKCNSGNKKLNKVLFILEKNINMDYILATHADIENISYYPLEKEVLFFPFSAFEIQNIEKIIINGENIYKIKLLYLDKYLKELENDISNGNVKIPNSEFKKQIIELGLIKEYKNKEEDTPKNLFQKFNEYKSKINKDIILSKINIKKDDFKKDNEEEKNYIISEIEIKKEDLNKNIRIINSYDNYYREPNHLRFHFNYNRRNEQEIMSNIIIKINDNIINKNDKIIPNLYYYRFKEEGIYKIKYKFTKKLTKCNYMFCNCESLISIDLSHFDAQNIIFMNSMFNGCESLNNINLSNINTQNVFDMNNMFFGCSSLTKIDLSNFNTQIVTNMNGMFFGCKSLTNIDLSNFNTQNVTNMAYMFLGCESLTNIDLYDFYTPNVTDMNEMFSGCKSLISIDISNFQTQNVIYMNDLFKGCESLISIDLSNFNTQNVIYINNMFSGCKSLKNIDLTYFSTKNVTNMDNMFSGCESLKKENILTEDIAIKNLKIN